MMFAHPYGLLLLFEFPLYNSQGAPLSAFFPVLHRTSLTDSFPPNNLGLKIRNNLSQPQRFMSQ